VRFAAVDEDDDFADFHDATRPATISEFAIDSMEKGPGLVLGREVAI
jgi:hypothetical protein